MEIKTKKLFEKLIEKLTLEILDEESLEEITTTAAVPGYMSPFAFGKKKKKQKKIGVNEDLDNYQLVYNFFDIKNPFTYIILS